MTQDIEKTKDTHEKLRNILIDYGCEEYGDAIVDEISTLFNFPTTIDIEPEEEEKTNVEFYVATYEPNESDEQPYKEVIAVFTEDWELQDDKLYYTCYASLGQHSTCSQSFIAQNCKKATEKEYKELKIELEKLVGYNLNVV